MDIHRLRAAQQLGIPPEEVTAEQRNAEKVRTFARLYGVNTVVPVPDPDEHRTKNEKG